MKSDPGSNYQITEVLPALSRTVDTYETDAIDHSTAGGSVSFLVTCGVWDTSFVATVQHSADDITYADMTADGSGNVLAATLTEADSAQLNVPNPTKRYTRLSIAMGGTCVAGVVAIAGPLENIEPDVTTLD